MANIRIVTDSTADIPESLANELGITVVPLYIHFGDQVFRAGRDISNDQFYRRLQENHQHPSTSAPPPTVFEQLYRDLARDYDAVISIHLSSRLGNLYHAALQARNKLPVSLTRVEVVDSLSASMGLGMVAIEAAKLARSGASHAEVLDLVTQMIQHTHVVFFVDTLEYLERSERLGMATAVVGSMQRIKPLMILDEGAIVPYDRTRTRAKAIEGLYTFIEDFPHVEQVAVMYSTTPEDVEKLLEKVDPIYARDRVMIVEYGPALITHLGPGAMGVAVFEGIG
jgi:DegV family protein with EDD domain